MDNVKFKSVGFFQNLTMLTIGNIIVRPIWIIFSIYLSSEYLGKEGFGIFNFTLSLMTVVAEMTDLGITHYANRELVRQPHAGKVMLINVLMVKAISTAIVITIVWGGAILWGSKSMVIWALIWAGLYSSLFRHLEFLRVFFRANRILIYESLSMIVEKVLVVIGGISFLLLYYSPSGVLFGMLLGMFLTFIIVLLWIHYNMAEINMNYLNLGFVRSIYELALPMGLMGLFFMAYRYMGILILYFLYGEVAVGLYSLPLRIVETLQLIPTILGTTIFAYFTKALFENRVNDFMQMLQKSLLGLFITGWGAVLITWAGGYHLIEIFRPEFLPAKELIKILIFSFPITCINSILVLALMSLDEQKFVAKIVALIVFSSLLVNYFLILNFDVNGAIYAFIITDTVLCCALFFRTYWKIKIISAG